MVSNQVTLTTEGAITFDVDVWRIDAANLRGQIETQELSLHVENRFLHNFGAARNFTLIDDIEVNRLEGQNIEFTFKGTDMHLEEYMRTERMEINTQSRMLLRSQFNGICEPSYRFSESVCERTFELDIPWGESDCGRFDERLSISIQSQQNGNFEVAVSVDRTLSNPTTGIQLIENSIVINKATGDDVVIQLRSEFNDIDDLSDYVYGIQGDLRPHLASNMFEVEQSETLSIELDDNPNGILRRFDLRSDHDLINGCDCTRFRIVVEEGKYSVESIEAISLTEGDERGYFFVRLNNAALRNPYTGGDRPGSKTLKNLNPERYRKKIDDLIPFYYQTDSKIEFYRTLVPEEFRFLQIHLTQQILDNFGTENANQSYFLCPFTLCVYSSQEDSSEIGVLEHWMRVRPREVTTASMLEVYNSMTPKWKVELRGIIFGNGNQLIDRLSIIVQDLTNPVNQDGIEYLRDLLVDLEVGNAITEIQHDEFYQRISEYIPPPRIQREREIREEDLGAWDDVEEFHDDGGGL
ncbi:MAG: hypothetical protein VXY42_01340 [Candidatus Thermoplasmatota archaeon]|nr:hypothetical protein [Candidatus Thermoplasmatota archaeon]